MLVDRDQTCVEPLHGERVLVLEVVQTLGLEREELVQLAETRLPEREIRLQGGETARDVADAALERVDLPGELADLRA